MARSPDYPEHHNYPNYARLREEHARATDPSLSAGTNASPEIENKPSRPAGQPGQSSNMSRPPGPGEPPIMNHKKLDQDYEQRQQSLDELNARWPQLKETFDLVQKAKAYEATELADQIKKDGIGKDELDEPEK